MTSNGFKKNRLAFTLVELLIVVGLIAFMSSMITYALLGAQTDSRVSRTRSTIQKLNEVILQQWEEYRYRPVDMRKDAFFPTIPMTPRMQTHLRMVLLRDTMRMELPDRVTDLIYEPSCYVVPSHIFPSPNYMTQRPIPKKYGLMLTALTNAVQGTGLENTFLTNTTEVSLNRGYFEGTFANQLASPIVNAGSIPNWIGRVDSSELLYLIVSTSSYGGAPALELFRPSEIGDSDNDGLLEFIDAWGKPIKWIRWPAGFPSDLNRYAESDAMDPLKTDWRFSNSQFADTRLQPQTIVPLIYSGGPDEVSGVVDDLPGNPVVYATMRQMSSAQSYIDPFFVWVNNIPNNDNNVANLRPSPLASTDAKFNRTNQLGSIDPSKIDQFADDITNHDLILEP